MTPEQALAWALREVHRLPAPRRLPAVGDIVEVDGALGICTEITKGWCYVRQLRDDDPWLDFVLDEARHGPCEKVWKVRDDLNNAKPDPKEPA